jgi:hypothetical protein
MSYLNFSLEVSGNYAKQETSNSTSAKAILSIIEYDHVVTCDFAQVEPKLSVLDNTSYYVDRIIFGWKLLLKVDVSSSSQHTKELLDVAAEGKINFGAFSVKVKGHVCLLSFCTFYIH